MNITYGQIKSGTYQIYPAKSLVIGFMVELPNWMEQRYALFPDGRVLKSEVRPTSHDFAYRGEVWTPASEIPADAIYIGHYAPPVR